MTSIDLMKALSCLDDDLISDAAEPPESGTVKGTVKGTVNGKAKGRLKGSAGGGKAPKPHRPDGGATIKVKTLVIGICAIVAAVAIVLVILFATGVLGSKVVPVYQGMVISAAEDTTSDADTAAKAAASYGYHGDYYGKNGDINQSDPYGTGGTGMQDEVQSTLTVAGAGEDIYYADAGDDIYINVKFYNPDYFVILSFVLTYGDENVYFANYNFLEDSDFENIIIKLNVGDTPGIIDYTISEIKYVDGNAIKDVTMNGDTVVSCGVRASSDMVTAVISDEEVTLTSISFTANISDNYSLIEYSGGTIEAILYDGESIISTQNLSLGKNTVTFTGLSADTLYQYAVVAYYDDLSGAGAAVNYLYTNAVYTAAVVLFDSIEVGQEDVTFAYDWYSGYTNSAITKLTLTANGETCELSDASALTLSGLYSDTEYTLTAYYIGTNGETTSITLTFTTLAKATPAVEITTLTSEQESVDYALTVTDTDRVGSLTSVTLTLDNTTVETYTAASGTFSGLLSDNTYTLTVVYTYDLNDGTGSRTAEVTNTITTKAKATPAVEITTLTSEQESVDYALTVTDTDRVGSLTSVTLMLGNTTVETYTAASGTFSGLLSDNTYTLTVVYTYDLNDGTGSHTAEVTKTIATKAKAMPVVNYNVDSTTDCLSYEISFTDPDSIGTITAIAFYNGGTLIENITDLTQTQFTFSGLSSYTLYTLTVTFVYDLNDGKGEQAGVAELEQYTDPFVEINSVTVLNSGAVYEGDTIVLQASMNNPNGVTFYSVVINGTTYAVSATSTSTSLRVQITDNDTNAGGEVQFTISQLTCTVDGNSFTIDIARNNTVSVFINGELAVENFSIVRLNDSGEYEEADYGLYNDKYYLKIALNNPTKYEVYKVAYTTLSSKYTSTDVIMSDDYQYVYVSFDKSDNEYGWRYYTLDSVSYKNSNVDGARSCDISIEFYLLDSEDIVEITTAEQLLDVDDYKYYKLMNDIDLSGYEWVNNNNELYGIFDGNGYTIKNMGAVATYSDTSVYLGLFSGGTGVVKDLTIKEALYIVTINSTTSNNYSCYAGSLFAWGTSIAVDNCNIDISFQITNSTSGNNAIGSIAGYNETVNMRNFGIIKNTIINAVFDLSLATSGRNYVGGIFGSSGSDVVGVTLTATYNITGCDVYAYSSPNGEMLITDCTATYTVTKDGVTTYYSYSGDETGYE